MQITSYSGHPIHARNNLGEFDFGAFIGKVAEGATAIYTAKAASDSAKATAKQQYELEKLRIQQAQNGNFDYSYLPNLSPTYGGGFSSSSFPIAPALILGGLGIAAYLMLRK